jgi:Cu/Zn superoxide dismutase
MKRLALLAVVALAVAACDEDDTTSPPTAENFTAALTGAKERPTPVTTAATGTASIVLSANRDTIRYTVTATGLSGAATAAHIHAPADTGSAAGPVATLTLGGTGNTIATGSFTALDAGVPTAFTFDSLVTLLRNGNAYVNVHTAANAGGEIRGQIAPQP